MALSGLRNTDFCYNTQHQPPHLSNTGVAVCVVYINNVYVSRERVQNVKFEAMYYDCSIKGLVD